MDEPEHLIQPLSNFRIECEIGAGSFGRVFKFQLRHSAQCVAIKFLFKDSRPRDELDILRREIEISRRLIHPGVVLSVDSFETPKQLIVVQECAQGNLHLILKEEGKLPEKLVRNIADQLVSALQYIHAKRVVHRDIKPQNILVMAYGRVALCDFGFARSMSSRTVLLTSIKGTPLYMAPEVVESKPYDHNADIWSLGVILYELFSGQTPFVASSIFELVQSIVHKDFAMPQDASEDLQSLLRGTLEKDHKKRLTWPVLASHPFIADDRPPQTPEAWDDRMRLPEILSQLDTPLSSSPAPMTGLESPVELTPGEFNLEAVKSQLASHPDWKYNSQIADAICVQLAQRTITHPEDAAKALRQVLQDFHCSPSSLLNILPRIRAMLESKVLVVAGQGLKVLGRLLYRCETSPDEYIEVLRAVTRENWIGRCLLTLMHKAHAELAWFALRVAAAMVQPTGPKRGEPWPSEEGHHHSQHATKLETRRRVYLHMKRALCALVLSTKDTLRLLCHQLLLDERENVRLDALKVLYHVCNEAEIIVDEKTTETLWAIATRYEGSDACAAVAWRILALRPKESMFAEAVRVLEAEFATHALKAVGACLFLARSQCPSPDGALAASLELLAMEEMDGFRSAFGSGLGVPEWSMHEAPLAMVLNAAPAAVATWDELAAVAPTGMSPRACVSLLKARTVVLKNLSHGGGPRCLAEHTALSLLGPGHLAALLSWPKDLGGGANGARRMVLSYCQMVEECLVAAPHDEWRPLVRALLKNGFVAKLTHAAKACSLGEMDALCSLLYLLFRHNVRFLAHLVEAPEAPWMIKALVSQTRSPYAIKIVAYLCRKHPEQVILRVPGLAALLAARLRDPDAREVCVALSSMCTVSLWAVHFRGETCELLAELLCRRETQRSAAAVVANLAFHSDVLYQDLRPTIPSLVRLLREPGSARINAASALVNLMRHGDTLCGAVLEAGGVDAMLDWCSQSEADELFQSVHVLIMSIASSPALAAAVLQSPKLSAVIAKTESAPEAKLRRIAAKLKNKRDSVVV